MFGRISPVKPSGVGDLFVGEFLKIANSISFMMLGLLKFSISFWGSVIPLLCGVQVGGEIKGSYLLLKGDVSCPTLLSLTALYPTKGKAHGKQGSLPGLQKLSQMMKTKKSGKGSFIPESHIVLLLVSVSFPKASSPGFPSISLKFRFLLCLN